MIINHNFIVLINGKNPNIIYFLVQSKCFFNTERKRRTSDRSVVFTPTKNPSPGTDPKIKTKCLTYMTTYIWVIQDVYAGHTRIC